MRKLIIVFVLLVFCASSIIAQGNVKFGLSGGLINVNADIDIEALGFSLASIDAVNETGFYIGAFVDIEATSKLHIQPELLYSTANDISFLHLPIMAKYYVAEKFNIQLGPQINFSTNLDEIKKTIGDIEEFVGSDLNVDDIIKDTGIDIAFGAGYDVSDKFSVLARYSIGLTDYYDGPLSGSLDIKTQSLFVGVGYSF